MAIKWGLMALLSEEAMYGARLRSEFEHRTGGTWPLNVGQVYTTLGRLERDGMVSQDGGPDAEGRIRYQLTPSGQQQVRTWWSTPVQRDDAPRDELVIKLAIAVTTRGVDVAGVVQTQRTATVRHLRDLTRLKRGAHKGGGGAAARAQLAVREQVDLAWLLVVENLIFAAESEVRWLDHVETMLGRHAATSRQRLSAREAEVGHLDNEPRTEIFQSEGTC